MRLHQKKMVRCIIERVQLLRRGPVTAAQHQRTVAGQRVPRVRVLHAQHGDGVNHVGDGRALRAERGQRGCPRP